ncbi:hypothetical protein yrohd0001_8550 [Yersinia rohdei ATCC 43380]|nr:hypothetical protein yrohd0001_8550 [Yersinia rohdei ATCC 43380]
MIKTNSGNVVSFFEPLNSTPKKEPVKNKVKDVIERKKR